MSPTSFPNGEAHLFRHHPIGSFWVRRALLEAGAELRAGVSPGYCMLAPISTLSVSDGPSSRWHGRVAAGIAGDAARALQRSPNPAGGPGQCRLGTAGAVQAALGRLGRLGRRGRSRGRRGTHVGRPDEGNGIWRLTPDSGRVV